MSVILGIDPALANLGYGVIQLSGSRVIYISSGTIKTSPEQEIQNRLYYICSEMQKIIEVYKPDSIAMEESFVNKNPSTSLKLGYVRGALMALIASTKAPYFEYKPNLIKKTVVGVGHAEKDQVIHMMKIILSSAPQKLASDEADALAVAYTCGVLGSKDLIQLY